MSWYHRWRRMFIGFRHPVGSLMSLFHSIQGSKACSTQKQMMQMISSFLTTALFQSLRSEEMTDSFSICGLNSVNIAHQQVLTKEEVWSGLGSQWGPTSFFFFSLLWTKDNVSEIRYIFIWTWENTFSALVGFQFAFYSLASCGGLTLTGSVNNTRAALSPQMAAWCVFFCFF